MKIIADLGKISKTVQQSVMFILNVLSESNIYFTQISIILAKRIWYFHIKRILAWNKVFSASSSDNEIVSLLVIFYLPHSKYRGMKICFYLCRYQNQSFSVVSHLCHSCSTCAGLVSFLQHLCRTCVVLVSVVSHSYFTLAAYVAFVSLVSGTRVLNQTR